MGNLMKHILGIWTFGIGILLLFSSCDRHDETYLIGKHRSSEDEEDSFQGIDFVMDSDSLAEEIEEIYFKAEEWGEETMDADL